MSKPTHDRFLVEYWESWQVVEGMFLCAPCIQNAHDKAIIYEYKTGPVALCKFPCPGCGDSVQKYALIARRIPTEK